ncbi:hypothetical protein K4F52_006495 [Lecanicillium sp. MT-2017a]|nr:hypothetical protein K4F52_006495 [Lecanicillium sp. MT-2017a]
MANAPNTPEDNSQLTSTVYQQRTDSAEDFIATAEQVPLVSWGASNVPSLPSVDSSDLSDEQERLDLQHALFLMTTQGASPCAS